MKVIILGDYSVGKTSLICRYIEGKFHTQEPVSLLRPKLKHFSYDNVSGNDDMCKAIYHMTLCL